MEKKHFLAWAATCEVGLAGLPWMHEGEGQALQSSFLLAT